MARLAVTEGLFFLIFHEYNPSVSFADSSPYTGEPYAAAGLLIGKAFIEPRHYRVVFGIQKTGGKRIVATSVAVGRLPQVADNSTSL